MCDTTRRVIPAHLQYIFENGCKLLTQKQAEQFKKFVIQYKDNFAKPDEVGRTVIRSN